MKPHYKFNQYPYETVYHIRLFQTTEHPEDYVYPWYKYYFRETFQTDTIYKQHWYRWEGSQQDIPICLIDHHRLLTSRAENIDNVTNDIRYLGIFIERNFQAHPTARIQFNIFMHTLSTFQSYNCWMVMIMS